MTRGLSEMKASLKRHLSSIYNAIVIFWPLSGPDKVIVAEISLVNSSIIYDEDNSCKLPPWNGQNKIYKMARPSRDPYIEILKNHIFFEFYSNSGLRQKFRPHQDESTKANKSSCNWKIIGLEICDVYGTSSERSCWFEYLSHWGI